MLHCNNENKTLRQATFTSRFCNFDISIFRSYRTFRRSIAFSSRIRNILNKFSSISSFGLYVLIVTRKLHPVLMAQATSCFKICPSSCGFVPFKAKIRTEPRSVYISKSRVHIAHKFTPCAFSLSLPLSFSPPLSLFLSATTHQTCINSTALCTGTDDTGCYPTLILIWLFTIRSNERSIYLPLMHPCSFNTSKLGVMLFSRK